MHARCHVLIVLVLVLLAGCGAVNRSVSIADGTTVDDDVSNINGSVQVGRECVVNGAVSNVNGSIRIGEDSQVESIRNVNGSIGLERGVRTGTVRNVNGAIRIDGDGIVKGNIANTNGRIEIGANGRISGGVSNVNGRVTVEEGSRIEGAISTVTGQIQMMASSAAGVETTKGNIELLDGTHIAGGLTVKRPGGLSRKNKVPRIVIGDEVKVDGPLRFEQEVELYVHETASVGEVSGAEPILYTGDRP